MLCCIFDLFIIMTHTVCHSFISFAFLSWCFYLCHGSEVDNAGWLVSWSMTWWILLTLVSADFPYSNTSRLVFWVTVMNDIWLRHIPTWWIVVISVGLLSSCAIITSAGLHIWSIFFLMVKSDHILVYLGFIDFCS